MIELLTSNEETTSLLSTFGRFQHGKLADLPRQVPLLQQLFKKLTVYKRWERVQKRVFAFGKMLRALRDTRRGGRARLRARRRLRASHARAARRDGPHPGQSVAL